MSRSIHPDNTENLARERERQARAQEGHVQRVEHGLATDAMYSATCTCGHVERSTIRHAAYELYLLDHILEGNGS